MQISLQKLRNSKDGLLNLEKSLVMDSLVDEFSGLTSIKPVNVNAQIELLNPHLIEARVKQSTRVTLSCSRCLSEYGLMISSEWKEWFTDEKHQAIETEEQEIHYISSPELDLEPYIRESILLQLPYVPICKQDCKGLCPKCGVNRNEVTCDCQIVKIDPRLAVLEDFFKSDEKE